MKKHRLVLIPLFLTFALSCTSTVAKTDVPPEEERSFPPVLPVQEAGEDRGEESPDGLAEDSGEEFPEVLTEDTGEESPEALAEDTGEEFPEVLAEDTVLPEPVAPESGGPGDQAPSLTERPSETPFAGEPPLAAAVDTLPEPIIDLPEIEGEEVPPGETPFAAALPEPVAPILPEPPPLPPPPAPAPEQPPRPAPVPEQAPPPIPVPEQPSRPVPGPSPAREQEPAPVPVPERPAQVSPAPPPFIRPAEEAPEPLPAPVPPPPVFPAEPPAWTRENRPDSRPAAPPEGGPALSFSPPASFPELFPAAEDDLIQFSRIVRATVGQLVEIPFRGTDWVYLGEMGFRQGLAYGSRRPDPAGQSFIFRAEAAGAYELKFYKQDFVRDYILNDYVQVIVDESPEAAATGWFNPLTDRGRAVAEPRWPTIAEEAEAFRSRNSPGTGGTNPAAGIQRAASQEQAQAAEPLSGRDSGPAQEADLPGRPADLPTVPSPAAPVPAEPSEPLEPPESFAAEAPSSEDSPSSEGDASEPEEETPDQYLRRAREEFDAGRVASALAVLDRFRENYPAGSDETWWLYGQFYEADSPSRDIRSSLDYYRRLLREYPQSSRCNEARRRIAYLERYYINIR